MNNPPSYVWLCQRYNSEKGDTKQSLSEDSSEVQQAIHALRNISCIRLDCTKFHGSRVVFYQISLKPLASLRAS